MSALTVEPYNGDALLVLEDGCWLCAVRSRSNSLTETAVLLRFVDIMTHLDRKAMRAMVTITWRTNDVHLEINADSDNSGEPFPRDWVERIGKRMAKILWNLGGPPYVWLTDLNDVYRFDWINPAVTGEAA